MHEAGKEDSRSVTLSGFILGAAVAGIFMLLCLVVALLVNGPIIAERFQMNPQKLVLRIVRSILATVPLAALLSGALASALHRQWNTTFAMCISAIPAVVILAYTGSQALGPLSVFFIVYLFSRHSIRSNSWFIPCWLFLITGLLLFIFGVFVADFPRKQLADTLAGASCGSLFITDSILLWRIGQLEGQGRLQPPDKGFRYSLSTLLLFVLCTATYVTVLVKMF
ncbi:MAG TPA: hypothetical protein VEK08_16780 [Planctomycetota bacterium]|nr:hypothetical protein [Planctomycetota bacterium]